MKIPYKWKLRFVEATIVIAAIFGTVLLQDAAGDFTTFMLWKAGIICVIAFLGGLFGFIDFEERPKGGRSDKPPS